MMSKKDKQVLDELMQLGYDRNFIYSVNMKCTEQLINPLEELSITLVDTSWNHFEQSDKVSKMSTKRWSAMRFSFTLGMGAAWFWQHRKEEVEQKGFFACMKQPRGYDYMDEYIEDIIGIYYNKESADHKKLHYYIHDSYDIINRYYDIADKQQEYAAAHVLMILGVHCQATRELRETTLKPYEGEMTWHWEVWNALYGVEDNNSLDEYNKWAVKSFQAGILGNAAFVSTNDEKVEFAKKSVLYKSVTYHPKAGMRTIFSHSNDKNVLLTAVPVFKPQWRHPLVIENVFVWENGAEATITAHFLNDKERRISFYDTHYLENKDQYYAGEIYMFEIYGIAYHAEIVPEDKRSFTFENEKAVNFNNKIGQETKYDEKGQPEPIVFRLNQLHSFIQTNDKLPEDASVRSPIARVFDNIDYLGKRIYEVVIELSSIQDEEDQIFHISVFANSDHLDTHEGELKKGEPFHGVVYMQGRMLSRVDLEEIPSTLLHSFDAKDKEGAKTIFQHKCSPAEAGKPMTTDERQQFARDVYYSQMSGNISIHYEQDRKDGSPDFYLARNREVWVKADPAYDAQALFVAENKVNYHTRAHMFRCFPVIAYISLYDVSGKECAWTKGGTYTAKIHYGSVLPGQKMDVFSRYEHEDLVLLLYESFNRLKTDFLVPYLHKDLDYRSNVLADPIITREEYLWRTEEIMNNNKKATGGPVKPKLTYDENGNPFIELHYPKDPSQKVTVQTDGGFITAISIEDLHPIPQKPHLTKTIKPKIIMTNFDLAKQTLENIKDEYFSCHVFASTGGACADGWDGEGSLFLSASQIRYLLKDRIADKDLLQGFPMKEANMEKLLEDEAKAKAWPEGGTRVSVNDPIPDELQELADELESLDCTDEESVDDIRDMLKDVEDGPYTFHLTITEGDGYYIDEDKEEEIILTAQEALGLLYGQYDLPEVFDGICGVRFDENLIDDKIDELGIADDCDPFNYWGKCESVENFLDAYAYIIDHLVSGDITPATLPKWMEYFSDPENAYESPITDWID